MTAFVRAFMVLFAAILIASVIWGGRLADGIPIFFATESFASVTTVSMSAC